MPQWLTIIFANLLWIVPFIAGGLLLWRYLEKKRTEAMKTVASDLDLKFSTATDDALLSKLQHISLFSGGKHHRMKNVMTSRKESMNLTIFDYSYVSTSGGDSRRHAHSVLVIESDSLRLPVFALRPEGLADRIGAALGAQDIDFDDHPAFSKSFVLEGEHEDAIRKVFDGELIEVLETLSGIREIAVAGIPGMLVYVMGSRQKPAKMSKFMDDGCAIFSAFVRRLSRQQ